MKFGVVKFCALSPEAVQAALNGHADEVLSDVARETGQLMAVLASGNVAILGEGIAKHAVQLAAAAVELSAEITGDDNNSETKAKAEASAAVAKAKEAAAAASKPKWTVEYRPEVAKWEVKEGLAHRGLFDLEEQANAFVAAEKSADAGSN